MHIIIAIMPPPAARTRTHTVPRRFSLEISLGFSLHNLSLGDANAAQLIHPASSKPATLRTRAPTHTHTHTHAHTHTWHRKDPSTRRNRVLLSGPPDRRVVTKVTVTLSMTRVCVYALLLTQCLNGACHYAMSQPSLTPIKRASH